MFEFGGPMAGDSTARMPLDWTGIAGKVADG